MKCNYMTSKLAYSVVTDDPWNEARSKVRPAGRKEHSRLDELLKNFLELPVKQDTVPHKIHWHIGRTFSAHSRGLDIKVIDIFSRKDIVVDFMTIQKQRLLPPTLS